MNRCLTIVVAAILLLTGAAVFADNVDVELHKKLERAFFKAFSTPEEFKGSEIFQLLDYDAAEIAQIGRITPRPASIAVQAENGETSDSFKNIRVVCRSVHYYNMIIDKVTFDFPDCRVNLQELDNGNLRFLAGDIIKLKTEVSQNDILKVFDFYTRAKNLSSLKLKLDDDKASLRGKIKKGFLVVEFKLHGKTLLLDPKKVVFNCNYLVLNGARMPRNATNAIFAQINPVFDATKTWLNLHIDSIKITNGFVETVASIHKKKG